MSRPAQTTSDTSVDAGEVARFEQDAQRWWEADGPFAPLHKLNPPRLRFIRDHACAHFGRDANSKHPLRGLCVLDIGCGGGLLAEPLARLGAEVTGIDASETTLDVARHHAAAMGLDIDYRLQTAEALAATRERFDLVVTVEVVEHVADVPAFLSACARLVRPGGALVAATLNRTMKSLLQAIVGAEYVLRWLPRGTHDWRKFVRPAEMDAGLQAGGVKVTDCRGVVYDPLTDRWRLNKQRTGVNYMAFGIAERGRAGGRRKKPSSRGGEATACERL